MEPLFINSYPRNLDLIKQINGYLFYRRTTMWIYNGLVIGTILLSAIVAVTLHPLFWLPCVLLSVILLINFIRYKTAIHNAMNHDLENCSFGTTVTVTVTREEVRHCSHNGAVRTLSFVDLERAVNTKDYILLFGRKNSVFPLHKESFTKGSCETFCYLLIEYGIELE